jgi:hypothetical protein
LFLKKRKWILDTAATAGKFKLQLAAAGTRTYQQQLPAVLVKRSRNKKNCEKQKQQNFWGAETTKLFLRSRNNEDFVTVPSDTKIEGRSWAELNSVGLHHKKV